MTEARVQLNSIDRVKAFAKRIVSYPCDCDLLSGNYVIDAKSLMGIFSLDLSKPLTLRIHENHADLSAIQEFLI